MHLRYGALLAASIFSGALTLNAQANAQELEWTAAVDGGGSLAFDGNATAFVINSFDTDYGAGLTISKHGLPAGESDWERPIAPPDGYYSYVADVKHLADGAGNLVVVGRYNGRLVFGAGEENETTLDRGAGGDTVFVARYAPDGSLLWADEGSLSSHDQMASAQEMLTAPDGGVVLRGSFGGHAGAGIIFGRQEARSFHLSTPEYCDRMPGSGMWADADFVVKYGGNGEALWAVVPGSPVSGSACDGSSRFAGLAIDGDGNVVVSGFLSGDIGFGSVLFSTDRSRPFIAKYGTDGTLAWVHLSDHAGALSTDASGNVFIEGAVISKYTPNGELLWSVDAPAGAGAMAVDATGDLLIAGTFADAQTFGPDEAGEKTLVTAGDDDSFLAKLAGANGQVLWVRNVGGDEAASLAVDGDGNCIFAGWFTGTAIFGAGEANETTLSAADPHADLFIARYTPDGARTWLRQAAGPAYDEPLRLMVDEAGDASVTGAFGGIATFDIGEAGETTLTGSGDRSTFVARWSTGAAPLADRFAALHTATEQLTHVRRSTQRVLLRLVENAQRQADAGNVRFGCVLLKAFSRTAERRVTQPEALTEAAGSIRSTLACSA